MKIKKNKKKKKFASNPLGEWPNVLLLHQEHSLSYWNVRYVNEERCERERGKKRMEERKIITKEEIFWSFLDEEMSVEQCALSG